MGSATAEWPSGSYGRFKEFDIDNDESYNMYRVEMWGSSSEGIEVGEIYMGCHSSVSICEAQDEYSASFVGSKSFRSCDYGYSGLCTGCVRKT